MMTQKAGAEAVKNRCEIRHADACRGAIFAPCVRTPPQACFQGCSTASGNPVFHVEKQGSQDEVHVVCK